MYACKHIQTTFKFACWVWDCLKSLIYTDYIWSSSKTCVTWWEGGGRCIIGTTDWWCIWPLKIFCMVWITYYHPALVQELPYIANYLVPTRTWDTKIQTEIKSTISFCYKIRRILLSPNISSLHSPFYCGCKHMALEELHHYVKFSH